MERHHLNQRRLRVSRPMRELSADVWLNHKQFIQPLFVQQNLSEKTPSPFLNHVATHSQASLLEQITHDLEGGVSKFLLFPIPMKSGDDRFSFDFITDVVKKTKERFGKEIWLSIDLCLCAYTQHGHCGLLNEDGSQIDNSASVEKLADYALQLALAGADCIAPSDMMDGRVQAIRRALDQAEQDHVSIMSYSSKFSSAFYGPFRDICNSSPSGGNILKDRRSYQISMFNKKDATATALRDVNEGADIIMVKPALPYLDIIKVLSEIRQVPLAAYQVSGEYQSIELMAERGFLRREEGHLEAWTAMVRSGANMIISYAARNAKEWIDGKEM